MSKNRLGVRRGLFRTFRRREVVSFRDFKGLGESTNLVGLTNLEGTFTLLDEQKNTDGIQEGTHRNGLRKRYRDQIGRRRVQNCAAFSR